MALYVFKSAVRMSNGPKDVLKAVGNRVGALMAEPENRQLSELVR